MPRCILPQSEQAELRAGVSSAQAEHDAAYNQLIQWYEEKNPTDAEVQYFVVLVEQLLGNHENLISAQNIAIKAGLTAEGELWES